MKKKTLLKDLAYQERLSDASLAQGDLKKITQLLEFFSDSFVKDFLRSPRTTEEMSIIAKKVLAIEDSYWHSVFLFLSQHFSEHPALVKKSLEGWKEILEDTLKTGSILVRTTAPLSPTLKQEIQAIYQSYYKDWTFAIEEQQELKMGGGFLATFRNTLLDMRALNRLRRYILTLKKG